MRPPIGKIVLTQDARAPVFEDRSGGRVRRVKRLGKIGAAVLVLWAVAICVAVFFPAILPGSGGSQGIGAASGVAQPRAGTGTADADLLIEASLSHSGSAVSDDPYGTSVGRPVCVDSAAPAGAAIAAAPSAITRVYALLSADAENAFLPLLRNCGAVDVVLPTQFEIDGPDLTLDRANLDAELLEAVAAARSARNGAMELWPVVAFSETFRAEEFLAGLRDPGLRAGLVDAVIAAGVEQQAPSLCLRLRDVRPGDAEALLPFLSELSARARAEGLGLCLVASLSDQLWASPPVVSAFDKVIVQAYQEPWIGSVPQPLAPFDWFRDQMQVIKSLVPADKLVVAVGGHAVDWISGRAVPERISLAEAMFRISDANAEVAFSSQARNSHAAFFDRQGNRHQIWLLDAASVYNSVQIMLELGITELAIPSLGEEEPAYWQAVAGELTGNAPFSFGVPSFPDNVVYTGTGSFYRLAAPARSGARLWRLDRDGVFIEGLRYESLPRPAHMERYGARNPMQIALTFDDGPDSVATAQILDALKRHDAPATFFVVGQAVLGAPELVERALDEGHTIGSHSFNHPHLEDLSPFMVRAELRANQSLIEGVIGRTPLIFRPPYVRGPGPLAEAEAEVFSIPEEEGHFIAGSDVVPPDWAGASATEIVRQVVEELHKNGGNVIVLHDGRSTGMHTAEAVDLLVPRLRALGYEIVPISVLLGKTPDAVMPPAGVPSSAFKGVSVSMITLALVVLSGLFWICIFASVLRSALYLYLSSRRSVEFPRNFGRPPSVAVVVPAYNEEKVIAATVRSVLASDYGQISCLVVDDGSTDATVQVVRDTFAQDPRVSVVTQPNQGKWRALNRAFELTDAEIAVCVDADTRIAPDAIARIVQPFSDSKVAAVAGTVVVGNDTTLLTRFQAVEYINAQQIGRRAHEHLNGILVVPGALGAWRVEAVRDVGLYSNETLTEDADLTIWLRRGGYRVAYAEDARSETEAPADVRSLLKQRLRWSFGNLQTLWKHRGALAEFGPKRVFPMLDMVAFGFLLPLLSPVLDLLFLYFLFDAASAWYSGRVSDGVETSHLAVFAVFLIQGMDIATAWIAHGRQKAPRARLLYLVPLMNLFYRPLLYITVYRALWAALSGRLARWNKLRRQGLVPHPETSGI